MAKTKKVNYIYAIGRRKEAVARARLFKGKGENMVNESSSDKYFPGEANKILFERPFALTETIGKLYATIRVTGGGINAQRDASVLGIARALEKFKKEHRVVLKKAGLLTRDGRDKERRKVGTGGKARRKKQSPKR